MSSVVFRCLVSWQKGGLQRKQLAQRLAVTAAAVMAAVAVGPLAVAAALQAAVVVVAAAVIPAATAAVHLTVSQKTAEIVGAEEGDDKM